MRAVKQLRVRVTMTVIRAASYFPPIQRYAGTDRSPASTSVADQTSQTAPQSSNGTSDKLASLLTEAQSLSRRQAQLSPTDYLTAKFTLEEQISAEKLKAGEDLDQFSVRVGDRVFNLAGKMYGPETLQSAKISDIPMVQVAKPSDFPEMGGPQNYLTQRHGGLDLKA
jgi:hypothetical protein